MTRRLSLLLLLLLAPVAEPASEGNAYQLLRSDPAGYATVTPGRTFEFPADHLPHPDYRIEWWYLTANLVDATGTPIGIHWTLFRQSLSPAPDPGGWASDQVWMAHAAISVGGTQVYEERFARGGIGQAGVEVGEDGQFDAWLDDWSLTGRDVSPVPANLAFAVGEQRVTLKLEAQTPWVLQGDKGFSRKSLRGQASYYYSQPHILVTGEITTPTSNTAVSGRGWLDREWSSQPLAPDQPGWDWLSLHLDDGTALMVYRLRQADGSHWISGSLVSETGKVEQLAPGEIEFRPIATTRVAVTDQAFRDLPLDWTLSLPGRDRSWTIRPVAPGHYLRTAFPYWEGPVTVSGSTGGLGFLELTGY